MKPTTLNANIIYLCGEFSHRFTLALSRKFEENDIDVTPEQFSVLVVLLYNDGITQKQIGENLNRDKTTIARVVNNMKKKGVVKQVTGAADNRTRLIYLTPKGRALQTRAVNISGMLYWQVMTGIDENLLQTGTKMLQHMLAKL